MNVRRAAGIPRAHQEGRDQLGVGVDRREGPDVAHAKLSLPLGGDVLRLGVDEAPNLVHLDALAGEIDQGLVLEADASLSDLPPELHDGVFGDASDTGGGADAATLYQGRDDLDSLRGAEHVCHTRHYT